MDCAGKRPGVGPIIELLGEELVEEAFGGMESDLWEEEERVRYCKGLERKPAGLGSVGS